jgi:hypothetical protein
MSASCFTRRFLLLCAGVLLASCGGSGGGNAGGGGAPPLYAIGGTVSGLQGVVVLENNGGDDVTVSANGAFAFPTSLADGSAYAVAVRTQPVGPAQTCTVSSGSGMVAGAAVNAPQVQCALNSYNVTLSYAGLGGSGTLGLEFTASNPFTAVGDIGISVPSSSSSGSLSLGTKPTATAYQISVLSQPTGPDETCTVVPSSGVVGTSDVNISVTCTPNSPGACVTNVQDGIPTLRTNGTVVTHSSNVTTDEVWAGDGTVHVISSPITIVAPGSVTIQPCATVQLAAGAGIDVRGDLASGAVAKLVASGSAIDAQPVVFQRADGSQTPSWGRLRGLNKNSIIDLTYAFISGGGNLSGSQLNAVISMTGSSTLPDPVLRLSLVGISAPAGTAVYLSNAAFVAQSDLSVTHASDSVIAMPAMALGTAPDFVSGSDLQFQEIKVVENANITDNLSITTHLPIHFKTDGVHVGGLQPTNVPNVTLTLGPGVTMMFEGITVPPMVTFGDLAQANDKNAALVVQGTAAQPVLFTSAKSTRAPGDWAGLWLATSNGSQIDHAIIEYAGGDASVGPGSCGPIDPAIHQRARNTAALFVGDTTDVQYVPPAGLITNSTFRNNTGSYAINAVWESAAFGPALNATNVFGAGPKFCTQNKNLIVGGCVVAGVDQSGCLVP